MYPVAAAYIIETDIELPLESPVDGMHVLIVSSLDPGVVFEKVIIHDGGYEKTFLKMPESPFKRQ